MSIRELVHPEGLESAADFLARTAWMFEPPVKSKFGAIRLGQLDDPGRQHEWLMHGWISVGDKSVVAGASRSGKSFLAIHISMSLIFNMPVFGIPIKPGGVIYQAGEGALGVKKRLKAWRQHHGVVFNDESPFVLLQRPIDIYRSPEGVKDLIDEINAHAATFDVPLRLVVIDTLAKATAGADEISGKDMGMVLDNVDAIQSQTGAHVMLVHHLNAGGSKVRGHSSIYANVDQVLLVERDEQTKIRTVVLDKQKDDEDGQRFQFDLPQVVIGIDEEGRQITSCVCTSVGEREAIRREEELKGFRLNSMNESFMKAFFDAEAKHGFAVPHVLDVPSHVRSIVFYEDVKRVFADLNPNDSLTPSSQTAEEAAHEDKLHADRIRKRIEKARLDLGSLNVIALCRWDTQAAIYHTGKALRAFPKTWKRVDDPDQSEIQSRDPSLNIPF
jgi:RecA-family ATPase